MGVVGAGGRAQAHCRALRRVDGVDLAAVCDVVPERARETADEHGVPETYADHEAMLEERGADLDVAYVVTLPYHMDDLVTDCLRADLHVFAEKPPGVTADQTRRWAALAEERDLRTMVGFQRRFHPLVAAAREAVTERSDVRYGVGTFHKQQLGDVGRGDGAYNALLLDAVHVVDLLVAMGGGTTDVHGFYGQLFEPPERFDPLYANVFAGVLEFANGGIGLLNSNRTAGGRALSFEMHGRAVSAYGEIHGDPELDELVVQRDDEPFGDAERLRTPDVVAEPTPETADGTAQLDRHFVEAVREDRPTRVSFREAVGTMEAVEGVLDGRRFDPALDWS